jgi:hypothetical protein
MKFKLLVLLVLLVFLGDAQNKITQVANFSFNEKCNDVWGYEDEFGNEYAIVGLYDGVSIIDITDPNNLQEVYRSYGEDCIW